MKNLIKVITIIILTLTIYCDFQVSAEIDLESIDWKSSIINHSIKNLDSSWDFTDNVESIWLDILTLIKYILSWVLVIMIVYAWIQMIISMWSDEEKLSTAKRQLRYTVIALLFINIPWTLYNMFVTNKWDIDWKINWTWSSRISDLSDNVFINILDFNTTFNWKIILFIETILFSIAIFVIILAGLRIISSRWQEDKITESKNKIVWSIIWLVFIWFIEAWQSFIYKWVVNDWATLFNTIEKLALFFAGPVAIFFLTLAWWYYITSNWDEERVKKAKSIIINTLIATVILLASHAFLKDLITLNI